MILIAGDSWGAGVWSSNDHTLEHNGLAQYLHDNNYKVINLSVPGGSNFRSLENIEHFLSVNCYLDISHIFVFQTDWMRDFNTITSYQLDYDRLSYDLKHQFITRFYKTLDSIGEKYKKTIHLIGGLADVQYYPEFEKDFPYIKIVCCSTVNTLLNESFTVNSAVTGCFCSNQNINLLTQLKENSNNKQLLDLLEDISLANERIKILKENPDYFFPDGVHGNKKYHQWLFKYINRTILSKEL